MCMHQVFLSLAIVHIWNMHTSARHTRANYIRFFYPVFISDMVFFILGWIDVEVAHTVISVATTHSIFRFAVNCDSFMVFEQRV